MSDGLAGAEHPGAEHLSLEALAELEEGIAADADTLQRHVDDCPACRARAGQLRASRALLSALPAEAMPADVAARIDAALAAESAPARDFAAGGNIVPMRARRTWWRGPNIAAAAAGVAVLALVGALVAGHVSGSSSPTVGADKSAGRNAPSGVSGATPIVLKQWQTGLDYNANNLNAYVTALVLGHPPAFPATTGGQPASSPAPTSTGKPSYSQDALRVPATVYACANLLAGHPVQPLAIDYARYDGKPAAILVLPGLSDPARYLTVYVMRSDCSESMTDFVAYTHVPRPQVR